MSILQTRAGYCTRSLVTKDPMFSEKELLEKAREAIKLRRGLIHGKFKEGRRVCALAAVAFRFGDFNLPHGVGDALQEFNDSMPRVTPQTRRKRVLEWIEKRLKEIP